MRAANLKTELVDWKVLNGQGDRGKSDELMRHVATLFSLTASHCTEDQVETYELVLQRLADMVGARSRSYAAQKLCHLDNAPYELIRRFAFDVISVADPVLRHSPLLSDRDLIEVGGSKGEAHMVAICMRQSLSEVVTDVFIRHGKSTVLIKLAANSSARITETGMAELQKRAANDQGLSDELTRRNKSDEPKDLASSTPAAPSAAVKLHELWEQVAPTVDESAYDLSRHSYLARYRFDPSLFKVERLVKQGLLDMGILHQFASNDQFADVVCSMSHLSGFPHQVVARMMSSLHWDQVLCFFKLLGVSDQLLKELLCCGPWMLCLTPTQVQAVKKQYKHLNMEAAKTRALLWPHDGLLLD